MQKIFKKVVLLILGFLFILQNLAFAADFKNNYTLEKIVIFSRHNLRAPLDKGKDSILYKVTPHKWANRAEKSGELSSLGGELEVLTGQYFKKWLENEKFFPENYMPNKGEVRFYANSVQRAIATAKYFSTGMLPIANVEIERRGKFNEFDPVFNFNSMVLPVNQNYQNKFKKEYNAIKTQNLKANAEKSVKLLEEILDFKNSPYAKENKISSFISPDKDYFTVYIDNHLHFGGSARPAMKAADALILEYYETGDSKKAAFGRGLTFEEWQELGRLNSLGLYSIFKLPSVSKIKARPFIKEIYGELLNPERKFSFLCGHDINIIAVLSALETEDYVLPKSIEPLAPIGVKFIIEKRKGDDGKDYAALKLLYQSEEQIRKREPLSLENPPITVNLKLKGLLQNSDGFYLFDDVMGRFDSIAK